MLSVTGLTKHYRTGGRTQTVFDDLDLVVERGESVALLGASGSGKTTLLNLISGIDAPDGGTVDISGTRVSSLDEPARTLFRRRYIGFVFQFFNLIPTLTVLENVALPTELLGEAPAASRGRALDLLDDVGLAGLGDRYPETLSGGEQQRTAIARALAHRPSLLLADEPTGNLDDDTGERVMSLLTSLARDHDTTLVLVTHSRSVAAASDRALALRRGRLED